MNQAKINTSALEVNASLTELNLAGSTLCGVDQYGGGTYSSQADGNPMIEPVISPALRVHSGRARPVQRPVQWQTGDLSRKPPWSGCTRVVLPAALSLSVLCVLIGYLAFVNRRSAWRTIVGLTGF